VQGICRPYFHCSSQAEAAWPQAQVSNQWHWPKRTISHKRRPGRAYRMINCLVFSLLKRFAAWGSLTQQTPLYNKKIKLSSALIIKHQPAKGPVDVPKPNFDPTSTTCYFSIIYKLT
jgi:hypothetical protein